MGCVTIMWIEAVIVLNPHGVWRKVVLGERILLSSHYTSSHRSFCILFIMTRWVSQCTLFRLSAGRPGNLC